MEFKNPSLSRREFIYGMTLAGAALALPSLAWAERGFRKATHDTIKLAFGSCNYQWGNQDFFRTIALDSPDAWIWLGDIVYTDFFPRALRRAAFDGVKNGRAYREFRRHVPILGTWDDHDMGRNNAGFSFKDKDRSQEILLDFLDEPRESPRRKQAGIYSSKVIQKGNHRVKVILFDERYFRQLPGQKQELLGNSQWDWFAREITERGIDFFVIGSSSQALSLSTSGDTVTSYPEELGRLQEILRLARAPAVLISGDRHFAEVSRIPFNGSAGLNGFLYDFTSSGLTHYSSHDGNDNPNSTLFYRGKNFGLLTLEFPGNARPIVHFQAKDPDSGLVRLNFRKQMT